MSLKSSPTRNIFKANQKYMIRKYYDGKLYTFGSFITLEDAMFVRDALEKVNYGFRKNPMKNISKQIKNKKWTGQWVLRKHRHGRDIYARVFNSLEEAQAERDYLDTIDWDLDLDNGAGEMTSEEKKYGSIFKRAKKSPYKSEVGS